jgi:predicted RNA polymerase sigma factor
VRRGRPADPDAGRADALDWPAIVRLYDQLLRLAPTPVVALNRAVAVAEVSGPAVATAAYARAAELTGNAAELAFLRQARELTSSSSPDHP